MANYFNLTLDTTGPSSPSISLENGAQYASAELITASISTGDATTTNYQMKLWGDIDLTWGINNGIFSSGSTTTNETDALWITYATSKQIQLATGDGTKTNYLKIRDDVNNESSIASDSIVLDTNLPIVTITGPDVSKISKKSGKNVSNFSFTVDTDFTEYKVKVVTSTGATHDTGTIVPISGGSTNMSGTGTFLSGSAINSTIYGTDLELASTGDGAKIVKVFAKDSAGHWSV